MTKEVAVHNVRRTFNYGLTVVIIFIAVWVGLTAFFAVRFGDVIIYSITHAESVRALDSKANAFTLDAIRAIQSAPVIEVK